MRRPSAVAVAILLVVLTVALPAVLLPRAGADPGRIDNLDGTSDAVWNFTNAANYTASNTVAGGGQATLRPQTAWWNSTSAADFAGPDSATNIDLATWPGDVILASTSGASTLVTIQPDPAAGADAYLDRANPGLNHGSDTTMVADPRTSTSRRPILEFSLASIPAGAVIDDAKLSLYMSAAAFSPTSTEVHSVTPSWNEAQVTWNDRLTGTPWTTSGGDYDAHVVDALTLNTVLGWKTWNVTQVVDLWYRGRLPNNGVILVAQGAGPNSDKTFWSSDYAVDPTLRPKLDVRYRLLGATGEYISKVGGPGSLVAWQSISWNFMERSFVTDEFNGASLDPKWTWTNPPASYDVGTTTPGSLHVVSSTGVDLDGPTFSGNVLANEVVGDFTAVAKMSGNPSVSGQKMGLMVLLNPRNWYAVQKVNAPPGAVNWQTKATADAVSAVRANVASGNPIPAWFRIVRSGSTFTAATSPDGATWTVQDTYTPGTEYPLEVRIGLFVADGASGTAQTIDVDYARVSISNDASVSVSTRLGNTSPVDGTWTGWSAPYPASSGSPMSGVSRYAEFRLSFSVTYPDHTPDVGDVNVSWGNYPAGGTLETEDFAPGDLSEWGGLSVVQTLNGQTISYSYSTNSGGSWTSVTPPASLQSVSTASGKIRFRAAFATSNATVTPILREIRLGYRHLLDHFYVTASPAATAGVSYTVTITAKDAGNSTMTWWTGLVALDARLADGVTPGGGVLGTTSVSLTSGGTATLSTETYTKAEVVRIRASAGSASGLSGLVAVSPGALDHITVTPGVVTILPLDSQVLSAQGLDFWNNPISGLAYAWSVTGGVGSLNASAGPSVNFTASPPPANGTVEVSVGAVVGVAQVQVVSGSKPWVALSSPTPASHLTGVATVSYTNSADAISIEFDYNDGTGWTIIGTTASLTGNYAWNTTGLNFAGGSFRAIVSNARAITNATLVTPIEVDNTPPTITLGTVTDNQSTSGTLTLTYATSADVVRVDFTYFDGAWSVLGSDLTIDGSYVWTPPSPINGVTVRAVAIDDVNLRGSAERVGIGSRTVGTNPPAITSIPVIHVRTGVLYNLNLTFYMADADTPLAALTIWSADPTNVSVGGGAYPALAVTYAAIGTYVVTLWASDGTDTAWTLLTVVAESTNPPAVVSTPPTVAFDEDATALNGFGAAATAYLTDPDGDPLSFSVLGNRSVHVRVNAAATLDFWADPNWFGAEGMRLRATDPNGGFAEVAFTVVVRSVDDPPVLTALPSLSFDAGTAHVLDLTPFISDVDTPLSAMVVTTDSPYVTATGLNLTLSFPSDWASADFRVTVSDGAAIASQPVHVDLRVVPAWWQAPYVLALPPIGVFVVVAMFAQRARWRPAKAFLVDESGRMLREFTLDPSCQITYDQAVQAGILDAVEKPIKVTRYHGQTVRGDALAVVLLAYGPVTLEHVEFAREMLVQIQDKFEDSLKQRLEEARAQEANLEAQMQDLAGQREAIDARASEIESMLQRGEAAQAKIVEDTAALTAKERDLVDRETEVAANRKSMDKWAIDLEKMRTSLEAQSKKIRDEATEVTARSDAVRGREDAAKALQATLRQREGALTEGEARLGETTQRLAAQEAAVETRMREAHERETSVRGSETTLEEARKKFETDQRELLEFKRSIDSRVAEVEKGEAALAARSNDLAGREARIAPVEAELAAREKGLTGQEEELNGRQVMVDAARKELTERSNDLAAREAALARGKDEVEKARRALEADRVRIDEMRRKAEATLQEAKEIEGLTLARTNAVQERETRIAPMEAELAKRKNLLDAKESELNSRSDSIEAKGRDLLAKEQDLAGRETALADDRVVFEEARVAFDSTRREFQDERAHYEDELRRRGEDLDSQAKAVGEQQLRLAQEKETFEASRNEKNHAILSREIELEARDQSLREKEEAVRAQAEDNARRFAELTAREETLEIEGAKQDKSRAELEARKTELANVSKDLDGKATRLRDEEARRAEELRTWQTTLESEQALLKEQRETFEQETASLRASWADRMMRLEHREDEVKDREEKVRADVEWVARNEEDIKRREKAADDALQSGSQMKADADRAKKDVEQRFLEVESRERALREEAAVHAVELTKQTEALKAFETELGAKRSELERDRAAQAQRFHQVETDLQKTSQALEAKTRELTEREGRIGAAEDSAREADLRIQRERSDLQATAKQLETRQLELAQLKDRHDSEAARVRSEAETTRGSLADKEANLRAERERLERDSSALQDTLGGKAKEMASREKALSAREGELRAEEQDLESRTRDLESKERQAEARTTELSAQAMALIRREQDLNARASQFDLTVRKFESETAEKRREWESYQATLRTQQAQLNATAETRAAEITKRMEEIEGRERSVRAAMAQLELERSKLETQAKAQAEKGAETDAAWQRSETRLAELKAKEDELLRSRQAFESERSAWSTRRAEELKQLEATRDAAGEQAQQAERLVADSQRRALVAEEAERAAKRQAADLVAQQTLLENRRLAAEKAERDAQTRVSQLQEESRKFAASEVDIAARRKDFESLQMKLTASERDAATLSAELRARKASLDQETARLGSLGEQLTARQRDLESKSASLDARSAQTAAKEQTLTTELQRADNLMEDLTKKEHEMRAHEEAIKSTETDLAKQAATLAARDAQLAEGMRTLERMRQEVEEHRARGEEDRRTAGAAREEAETVKREAEKLRAQADAMQAEVSKNLRFLQKKALDVLDQEEKLRVRSGAIEEQERALDTRGEILEGKERALEADEAELDSKTSKLQAEIDRLRSRLAEAEKAGGPSTVAMDEWKRDVDNRVKIIQKKAMELLDREEKLRKKEEELRALAEQLGVNP